VAERLNLVEVVGIEEDQEFHSFEVPFQEGVEKEGWEDVGIEVEVGIAEAEIVELEPAALEMEDLEMKYLEMEKLEVEYLEIEHPPELMLKLKADPKQQLDWKASKAPKKLTLEDPSTF